MVRFGGNELSKAKGHINDGMRHRRFFGIRKIN